MNPIYVPVSNLTTTVFFMIYRTGKKRTDPITSNMPRIDRKTTF